MLKKYPVFATLPFNGLEKAEAFYVDKLGLKLKDGSVNDGYMRFMAGDDTALEVFESDSEKSNDTAATFQVKDLDKEMEELRAKGIVFEEYDMEYIKTVNGVADMGGMRAAWFKDPGGNVLCLHEK